MQENERIDGRIYDLHCVQDTCFTSSFCSCSSLSNRRIHSDTVTANVSSYLSLFRNRNPLLFSSCFPLQHRREESEMPFFLLETPFQEELKEVRICRRILVLQERGHDDKKGRRSHTFSVSRHFSCSRISLFYLSQREEDAASRNVSGHSIFAIEFIHELCPGLSKEKMEIQVYSDAKIKEKEKKKKKD